MMKALAIVIVALFAVVVSAAVDEKVVTLTSANFEQFVKDTPLALIEFYAPWCGHCKSLAPEYEKAAKELDGKNSGLLAKVDCTTERDICEQFEVQGFPTVKVFRNDGSKPGDYEGARKTAAIVSFMKKQSSPAVTTLTDAASVDAFTTGEELRVVAFLAADSEALKVFTAVANSLRNEYSFGASHDAEAATAKGAAFPSVVLFRNFDEPIVKFTGEITAEGLTTWIRAESFPVIGEIGPENYAKYLERGFNFAWIFVDYENKDQQDLLVELTPVAAEFRAQLSFVKLDGIKWTEHAKSFGLSGNTPGIVIEDRKQRKNFVLPESLKVTRDVFREFIDGVLSGKIAATVKSEPIPESNDGPVKVIVGHTFQELVMDDTKDVLVEFYAPWCGHCKSLAPKYEELGKLFSSDNTVTIAKIDATANDSPADVQGFPTIILYAAGDKQNPVNYEGERTVKALAAFLNAHGKAGGRPSEAPAAADDEEEEEHDHAGHDHEHDHDHVHDPEEL
jgi:protein disulfide-isomerase A1